MSNICLNILKLKFVNFSFVTIQVRFISETRLTPSTYIAMKLSYFLVNKFNVTLQATFARITLVAQMAFKVSLL